MLFCVSLGSMTTRDKDWPYITLPATQRGPETRMQYLNAVSGTRKVSVSSQDMGCSTFPSSRQFFVLAIDILSSAQNVLRHVLLLPSDSQQCG